MVLGQPTPLFQLSVAQSGSRTTPLFRKQFIVTDDPPRTGFRAPGRAYDILAEAFGIENETFTREDALSKLSDQGFRREGPFLFNDLIDEGSLLEV